MKRAKAWSHLAVVAAIFALVGWGAAALWLKNEPKAEALSVPRAARVERVDGEVGLYRGLASDQAQPDAQWEELTPNTPVTAGDRIYVRDNSEASVAFTGRNFARLDPDTAIDVLSLSDERTQLALRDGSAVFNLGALRPGELYEVATPRGAFELREPGFYQVGMNDDGSAWVSVLSGLAQVVGLAGSGQIGKGEMLTLLGQTAADIALSRLSPDYAGGLLDDYYGYQYPDTYDGRYQDYNAYLSDPGYYDPYNRYESYRHVSDTVPGVYELDRYGQWQDVSGYGTPLWRPRVDAGWAPYREGYWTVDEPYGLTWVSTEPWGYAPYHYGRWASVNDQWYWVPEGVSTQPAYSPALVAFLPLAGANQIAWVPLAPGDQYATPYYDANWQPHYYGDPYAAPQQVVNLGAPGGVTVVPAEYFNQYIDDGVLVSADPRLLGDARPVLEPFSVAELRQAALATANSRRRVDIPPGVAKKLDDTYVYTSARPFAPPFLEGKARPARAEVVGERQKRQKLQFKDERSAEIARQPGELRARGAGRARALERANEAAQRRAERAAVESNPGRGRQFESNTGRGRQEERRLARELERQNRASQDAAREQQRAAARAERATQENLRRAERARAQGERVSMRQQQKHAQRQQVHAAPQQHQQQRRADAPPQWSRPQREAQRPQQPQVFRQQQKAERRQGPPAHAGGGGGGGGQRPAQGPQQSQGKGKGKGRP